MIVRNVLRSVYNRAIADHVVQAYQDIESNYALKKWSPSELNGGHFVEAVRRLLELQLTRRFTPFNRKLPRFDDKALQAFEQQKGDQSYRLLIPRLLKAIYNVRNKRGVAHISDISPNEMDSTLILNCAKWILAELIRLNSDLSIADTQKAVDQIVTRHIPLIWKKGDLTRILRPKMRARDQILVLLYDSSPKTVTRLRECAEYKNLTYFRKILHVLHNDRLIIMDSSGQCNITPAGNNEAERIITEAGGSWS